MSENANILENPITNIYKLEQLYIMYYNSVLFCYKLCKSSYSKCRLKATSRLNKIIIQGWNCDNTGTIEWQVYCINIKAKLCNSKYTKNKRHRGNAVEQKKK